MLFLTENRLIRREFNEPTENRSNPNQEDLEKLIEVQNKEYYELYDNLAKYVSVADRCNILGANLQPMFLDPTDVSIYFFEIYNIENIDFSIDFFLCVQPAFAPFD